MNTNPPRRGDRWRRTTSNIEQGFSLEVVAGGVLGAILGVIAFTVVSSGVVYFTSLDERILGWAVNIGSFVILGAASFFTARRTESYGLLYGLSIGGFYAVLTFIVGTLVFPPFVGFLVFVRRLGFALLAGACGGVLGVNT
jgi:putative membrane protein (TIGR04086 family)